MSRHFFLGLYAAVAFAIAFSAITYAIAERWFSWGLSMASFVAFVVIAKQNLDRLP